MRYLWVGGRQYFVDDQIIARVKRAVADAGSGTAWVDLYGADSVTPTEILVGAGIPLVIGVDTE